MDDIRGGKGFFTKHPLKNHFIVFQSQYSGIDIDRAKTSAVPSSETFTDDKIGLSESACFKGFEFENKMPIKVVCVIKLPQ